MPPARRPGSASASLNILTASGPTHGTKSRARLFEPGPFFAMEAPSMCLRAHAVIATAALTLFACKTTSSTGYGDDGRPRGEVKKDPVADEALAKAIVVADTQPKQQGVE